MISIVCVYNDEDFFDRCLRKSLLRQSAEYELLPVDNRSSRYPSAAAALNAGAEAAKGQWIMFAHQDIRLIADDWLTKAEGLLDRLGPDFGWAGVAGRAADGAPRGFLLGWKALLGEPFSAPTEVQTLDECVLITRTRPGSYFDEQLGGWHIYGVDACCRAALAGKRNYVLSLLAHHDSRSLNLAGLSEAHKTVWDRHGAEVGTIWTSCGRIGPPAGSVSRLVSAVARRANRWLLNGDYIRYHYYEEAIDRLLPPEEPVDVFHIAADHQPIEVSSLDPQARRPRLVTHRFSGLDLPLGISSSALITPELASTLPDESCLPAQLTRSQRTLVCLPLKMARTKRRLLAALRARSNRTILGEEWSDRGLKHLFVVLLK